MDKSLKVTALRAAAVGGVAMALSLTAVPGARATGTKAVGSPVRGLDISAYQHYQHAESPIDWGRLVRDGIRFVAVKVAEGTYYLNPYYPSDARAAAAAGLPVLPYVFANPGGASGTATASFAVSAARTARGAARLPLVVDLENDPFPKSADCYDLSTPAMIGWIAAFTARVEALTGRWPIIYTTDAWWHECTGSSPRFRHDPLWLAAFDGTPPTIPPPWQNWTFWQYNNAGSLPGIGQADLDYYRPTATLPALRPPPTHPRKPPAKNHPRRPTPKTRPLRQLAPTNHENT